MEIVDLAKARERLAAKEANAPIELHSKSYFAVGDKLLELLELEGPVTYDEASFWRYRAETGTWSELTDETIERAAQRLDGALVPAANGKWSHLSLTRRLANDARGWMRSRAIEEQREGKRPSFARARPGVQFRDWFVTVENGSVKRLAKSPEHGVRFCFNADFDEDTFERPAIEEALRAMLAGRPADDAAQVAAMVQEFVGASLLGEATKWQKALILLSADGGGGEGKSTLLSLIKSAFPNGSTSSIEPHKWGQRFTLSGLKNKLLNAVSELPSSDLTNQDTYKAVVTGDAVTAEQKYSQPFELRPIAGHIFAANQAPISNDHTEGFWRRNLPVVLSRQFHRDASMDVEYSARFTSSEIERARNARWAIEGFARLQRQGRYTQPASTQAAIQEWRIESDPVLTWLLEARPWHRPVAKEKAGALESIVTNGNAKMDDLFAAFDVWREKCGHNRMSRREFARRLKASKWVTQSAGRAHGRQYRVTEAYLAQLATDDAAAETPAPTVNHGKGHGGFEASPRNDVGQPVARDCS